jgi:hypothetical protein
MAIIVETGGNIAGAESYATVAYCDTYFSNRGIASWALLTTAQKEENLRKSTDFMTQRYRLAWKGYRKFSAQALDFPRELVYLEPQANIDILLSDTIVPNEVKNACAELALKASTYTDGLLPDVTNVILEETIGPITTKYDRRNPVSPVYKAIDAMLAPLLKDNGMDSATVTVQRA